MLENPGTRFGLSRTDLGLKMVSGCFTCVLNCGLGCCEVENDHVFRFQRSGTEVDEGAVHGQPTHYFPNYVLDQKRPCELT